MKSSNLPPEFETQFGRPTNTITLSDGATAWVWEVDPAGKGIAVARSASAVVDGVHMQVSALQALAGNRRLTMRQLVVSVGLSGDRRFHERPDLIAVKSAVEAQPRWCEFVAFTEASRISGLPMGLLLFSDYLRQNQTELLLASGEKQPGPAALSTMAAAHDRSALLARTGRAIRLRLEDGRMKWLGAPPFGFKSGFAADPKRWPYVQFIFERIDEAPESEPLTKTLHRVCNELCQAGVPMRETSLRRIIANRIYTGGERWTDYDGSSVKLPAFALPDPIPEDVSHRVYARLNRDTEERARRIRSSENLRDA